MPSRAGGSGQGVPGSCVPAACRHHTPAQRVSGHDVQMSGCLRCQSAILGLSVIAGWTDRMDLEYSESRVLLKRKLGIVDILQMWKVGISCALCVHQLNFSSWWSP